MKNTVRVAIGAAMFVSSLCATAYEAGDWIARVGAATVAPNEDSDNIVIPTSPSTTLRGVDVDSNTQLGLVGAYMLSNNFGVELLAATPFEHDISVSGTNIDAGSTKHLPPTVVLQWYPRGGLSGWQPYLGAGINYTYFFDEDVDSDLSTALGALIGATDADLELDDSTGLALQVGMDYPLNDRWAINIGVWYLDIETTAKIKTDVGNVKFDVDIDPWVYNIGIAYKF
ncbi:MAG: OmpW family protein [Halioglobus sp.]